MKKLSELIREGAKLRPQSFGWTFKDGKSCAVGAAVEAFLGRPPTSVDLDAKFDMIPSLGGVYCQIAKWNDRDHLSREEIADRLEKRGL